MPKSRIAKRLGKNRETIHLWLKGIEAEGLLPFLERERGVHLSVPKVYDVLRERYVIRSKWKKNRLRGPVPQAAPQPRTAHTHHERSLTVGYLRRIQGGVSV
ncbi:MAG: hypothetical protein AAB303_00240 [Chloroflexota bacterium]